MLPLISNINGTIICEDGKKVTAALEAGENTMIASVGTVRPGVQPKFASYDAVLTRGEFVEVFSMTRFDGQIGRNQLTLAAGSNSVTVKGTWQPLLPPPTSTSTDIGSTSFNFGFNLLTILVRLIW